MDNLHVIVGLGVSGFSSLRYLAKQNIPLAITDTRPNPPFVAEIKEHFPNVILSLGKLDTDLLEAAKHIIVSPGISLQEPAIVAQLAKGRSVIGDIELFAQAANAPIIAITGTNAKSTVTTLVGLMVEKAGLKVKVGGNLGIPALDLLNGPKPDIYVLELSSFQLETTFSLKAHAATILNITPDHLDRHGTFEEYCLAKQRIYLNCYTAVCNRDDPLTECKDETVRKIYFTLNEPNQAEFGIIEQEGKKYLAFEKELLLAVDELPIKGRHYQANALASLALGYSFGLDRKAMLATLKEFKGLAHRCQWVRERQGVVWYNDSKGTNVGATQAAIVGLGAEIKGKLILIAGGVGKGADFSPLVPVVEQYVRAVVLIGEAGPALFDLLHDKVLAVLVSDMQGAVKKAAELAQRGDSVLLSPACASFDMFKNFEHRGAVFTEMTQELA